MSTIPFPPEQELPPEEMMPPEEMPVQEEQVPTEMMGAPEMVEAPKKERKPISEELQKALLSLKEELEQQDQDAYDRLVLEAQKLEKYWQGLQDLVWDPVSRDWISTAGVLRSSRDRDDVDPSVLEKVVNIYRANGESVIAAISSGLPYVRFSPDDAESGKDISTAKMYDELSELIQKQNDAQVMFMHALFIAWNQHYVCAYNYHAYDPEFGVIERPKYGVRSGMVTDYVCPSCGMASDTVQLMNTCEFCGYEGEFHEMQTEEEVPFVDSVEISPKTREVIEVYGPRNVRVPVYIKNLKASPYLILATEHHVSQIIELFPDLEDEVSPVVSSAGVQDRESRKNPRSTGDDNDIVTLQRVWFRPWTFNYIKDKTARKELRKRFPEGVCVSFVSGDIFAEAYADEMDDHWTFVPDPFTYHITGIPLGAPLVPIQDTTNDIETLSIDTVLHGIPETFADTDVLNFKEYDKSDIVPGQVVPAKAKDGQSLSGGFHTVKAATLGQEVAVFRQQQDSNAQFVTGAIPSIYGGVMEGGGSKVLGVYQQSRTQGLQRLSVKWKMLNIWWSKIMYKAVRSFHKNMVEDLRNVKKVGGSFINVWIRKTDMEGHVGNCEPETSEQFPVSWEQMRGLLMELLQLQLPGVNEALLGPDNVEYVARVFGLREIKLPGEDDHQAQLIEIDQILRGEQVQIDPDVDNLDAHIYVCKSVLNSERGRALKQVDPEGYQAIVSHLQEHLMLQQQIMMEQQQAEAAAAGGGQVPPDQNRPDQGASEAPSAGTAVEQPQ